MGVVEGKKRYSNGNGNGGYWQKCNTEETQAEWKIEWKMIKFKKGVNEARKSLKERRKNAKKEKKEKEEVTLRMNKPRSLKNCWAKTMKNSFSWLSLTSAMVKRWWQDICLYNGCVYLWGGNLVLREKSMETGSAWLQETLRGCSTVG